MKTKTRNLSSLIKESNKSKNNTKAERLEGGEYLNALIKEGKILAEAEAVVDAMLAQTKNGY